MWAIGKHSKSNTTRTKVAKVSHHLSEAGFSLIELMVVIIIMGLMASVVVLNLPSNKQTLRDDSEVIAARLQLAAQEAILTGNIVGLTMDQTGYGFLRRIRGQWTPYAPAGLNGTLAWPDNIKLDFHFEGEKISLARNSAAPSTTAIPSVFFLPSGEAQNFTLTLSTPNEEEIIQVDDNGAVTLVESDAF